MPSGKKFSEAELIGQKWGRLTIVGGYDTSGHITASGKKQTTVMCDCECGTKNKKIVLIHLTQGHTKSCGCLAREVRSQNGKKVGEKFGLLTKYSLVERSARSLFKDYMKRHDGSLTFVDFFALTQQPCFYCGLEPRQKYSISRKHRGTEESEFVYNGLDRIDSNKGYDLDNVVPCCKACNFAKHTSLPDNFYVRMIQILQKHNDVLSKFGYRLERFPIKKTMPQEANEKIQKIIDLLEFTITLDDKEIQYAALESILDSMKEFVGK